MPRFVGRAIMCNLCTRKTAKGTTQVYKKLMFSFCPNCWWNKRLSANALMEKCGR